MPLRHGSSISVITPLKAPLSRQLQRTSCVPASLGSCCHREDMVRAQDDESVMDDQVEAADWLWIVPRLSRVRQGATAAGIIALRSGLLRREADRPSRQGGPRFAFAEEFRSLRPRRILGRDIKTW